jgi:hypothetical protein
MKISRNKVQVRMAPTIECLGDRGYQGLQQRHARSRTPIKKLRGRAVSKENERHNRQLAIQRIICEQVSGKLTVLKILAGRYRNRRRRFGLRVHLLAAVYNLELRFPK